MNERMDDGVMQRMEMDGRTDGQEEGASGCLSPSLSCLVCTGCEPGTI